MNEDKENGKGPSFSIPKNGKALLKYVDDFVENHLGDFDPLVARPSSPGWVKLTSALNRDVVFAKFNKDAIQWKNSYRWALFYHSPAGEKQRRLNARYTKIFKAKDVTSYELRKKVGIRSFNAKMSSTRSWEEGDLNKLNEHLDGLPGGVDSLPEAPEANGDLFANVQNKVPEKMNGTILIEIPVDEAQNMLDGMFFAHKNLLRLVNNDTDKSEAIAMQGGCVLLQKAIRVFSGALPVTP